MNVKNTLEKAAPALVAAAIIATVTATYQFAQMRVEIEALKTGQSRVEAKVDAIIARTAHWRGDEEPEVLKRMAAQPAPIPPGVAYASEK